MSTHRRSHLASIGVVMFLAGCSAADADSHSDSSDITFSREQGILGGTVDKTDNAVVAILTNSAEGISLCSGTLIAPNLVLTAQHCVATPPSNTTCGHGFTNQSAAANLAVTLSYNAATVPFNSTGQMPAIASPPGSA